MTSSTDATNESNRGRNKSKTSGGEPEKPEEETNEAADDYSEIEASIPEGLDSF